MIFIPEKYLELKKDRYHFRSSVPTLKESLSSNTKTTCELKFNEDLAPGDWTAFHLENDIILTAAHCVNTLEENLDPDIKNGYLVFGYKENMTSFPKSSVYSCKNMRVIARKSKIPKTENSALGEKDKLDWAIKLNQDIIDDNGKKKQGLYQFIGHDIDFNLPIFCLGYSLGLSMKYTSGPLIPSSKTT
jgi:hypothetical protein